MKRFFPALASCAVALSFALSSVAAQANPDVLFKTSLGDFTVELEPAKAPKTVDNFLAYVKEGHYNGTVFHRVIPGFMVQGGGFTTDMKEKPTHAPIAIESRNGLKNLTGTIAMARTSDPNSATSQFFVNVVDNADLDFPKPDGFGYTVFGKVVSGMDVVKKIELVPTHSENMMQDVPRVPVIIQSATVVGN